MGKSRQGFLSTLLDITWKKSQDLYHAQLRGDVMQPLQGLRQGKYRRNHYLY